jgi:hypothetical protein
MSHIAAAAGRRNAVRLFAYLSRRQEVGAFQRHPRDRTADLRVIAELRMSHDSAFDGLWEQGYRADQAELVGLILTREHH